MNALSGDVFRLRTRKHVVCLTYERQYMFITVLFWSFGMRISCLFKRMVAVYTPGGLWRVCPLEEQLPKLGKPFPATMKRCETCLNMWSEDLGTLNP